MAISDFLPFATDPSAVVQTQAAYAASSPQVGAAFGLLPQENYNKQMRQGNLMAYVIGQLVLQAGLNALDDGNLPNLVASVKAALGQLTTWTTLTGSPPNVSVFPNNAGYIVSGGIGDGFFDVTIPPGFGLPGTVISGSLFVTPQPGSWKILNYGLTDANVFYWLKRVA